MEPLVDKEAREAGVVRSEAFRRVQPSLQRPAAFHLPLAILAGIRGWLMRWTVLTSGRRMTVADDRTDCLRDCTVIRRNEPRKNHNQRHQEQCSSSLAQSQKGAAGNLAARFAE
jgi:hypothetical protein